MLVFHYDQDHHQTHQRGRHESDDPHLPVYALSSFIPGVDLDSYEKHDEGNDGEDTHHNGREIDSTYKRMSIKMYYTRE